MNAQKLQSSVDSASQFEPLVEDGNHQVGGHREPLLAAVGMADTGFGLVAVPQRGATSCGPLNPVSEREYSARCSSNRRLAESLRDFKNVTSFIIRNSFNHKNFKNVKFP